MAGYSVKISEEAYWQLYERITELSKQKREKVTMKDYLSKMILENLEDNEEKK